MIVYKQNDKTYPWVVEHNSTYLYVTKKDMERLYKQLDQILWDEDTKAHSENIVKKS